MRRLAIACVLLACSGPRVPAPPYVKQPTEALEEVDYPPPPARVEVVPKTPTDTAVWIDGEWTWQGGRWAWKPGRWVVPPANASFSPWTTVRDKGGVLYAAEGKWRDAQGHALPDPEPLAVARTRAGPVTTPEGEDVSATPNVSPVTPPPEAAGGADGGVRPETPSGATPTGTERKTEPTEPKTEPTEPKTEPTEPKTEPSSRPDSDPGL